MARMPAQTFPTPAASGLNLPMYQVQNLGETLPTQAGNDPSVPGALEQTPISPPEHRVPASALNPRDALARAVAEFDAAQQMPDGPQKNEALSRASRKVVLANKLLGDKNAVPTDPFTVRTTTPTIPMTEAATTSPFQAALKEARNARAAAKNGTPGAGARLTTAEKALVQLSVEAQPGVRAAPTPTVPKTQDTAAVRNASTSIANDLRTAIHPGIISRAVAVQSLTVAGVVTGPLVAIGQWNAGERRAAAETSAVTSGATIGSAALVALTNARQMAGATAANISANTVPVRPVSLLAGLAGVVLGGISASELYRSITGTKPAQPDLPAREKPIIDKDTGQPIDVPSALTPVPIRQNGQALNPLAIAHQEVSKHKSVAYRIDPKLLNTLLESAASDRYSRGSEFYLNTEHGKKLATQLIESRKEVPSVDSARRIATLEASLLILQRADDIAEAQAAGRINIGPLNYPKRLGEMETFIKSMTPPPAVSVSTGMTEDKAFEIEFKVRHSLSQHANSRDMDWAKKRVEELLPGAPLQTKLTILNIAMASSVMPPLGDMNKVNKGETVKLSNTSIADVVEAMKKDNRIDGKNRIIGVAEGEARLDVIVPSLAAKASPKPREH